MPIFDWGLWVWPWRRRRPRYHFGHVLVIPRAQLPPGMSLIHPLPYHAVHRTRRHILTTTATPTSGTTATPTAIALSDDQLALIPISAADELGVPLGTLPSPTPAVQATDSAGQTDMSAYIEGAFVEAQPPAIPVPGYLLGRGQFQEGQSGAPKVLIAIGAGTEGGSSFLFDLSPGAATTVTEGAVQTISRSSLPAGITLAPPAPFVAQTEGAAPPDTSGAGGNGGSGAATT